MRNVNGGCWQQTNEFDNVLARLRYVQDFLDRKAAAGLSYSVVAHLRWDLRQVFNMAVVRGYLKTNPAALLIIPRECKAATEIMNTEQVRLLLSALDTRERLIAGLAV